MKKIIVSLVLFFATFSFTFAQRQTLDVSHVERYKDNLSRIQVYLSAELQLVSVKSDTVIEFKKGKAVETVNTKQKIVIIRTNERGQIQTGEDGILMVRFDTDHQEMIIPFKPSGPGKNNSFVFCPTCVAQDDEEEVSGLSTTPVAKKKIIKLSGIEYSYTRTDISLEIEVAKKTKSKTTTKTSKGVKVK